MSTISLELVPGYTFPTDGSVRLDYSLLNLLGRPTINLTGAIGTLTLADLSVTTAKLADNALAANTTGRAKMQDGFFSAAATGRAKFAANFFGVGDATSLAFFETGFWTADATGRAKMADSFVTGAQLHASVAAVIATSRNLVAKNNAGTPTSKVDVTADEVILKDASSKPYLVAMVSVTADITTSGANGLDTSTEASSTWYYIWVIYNGTTVASLLSTSATAPTMPSGYTFKALIGAVRNDGSSNFLTFYQLDRLVFINDTVIFTGKAGSTSWTAITSTDLTTFQGLVPPIAKAAQGNMGAANDAVIAIGADANGLGACISGGQSLGATVLSYNIGGNWRVPLKTAQTVYYIMGGTSSIYRLSVTGYTI